MAEQNALGKYLTRNSQQGMERETVYDVGLANKYGDDYSSLVANNPYATMDYRKSPWQKFLTALGFRTNYDEYKESLALQAKEYDAQVGQVARQEEYDSAAAQAQRMREAGLNPDLQDVSAGESSPMPDDGNPPVAPDSDAETLMNFGSVVMTGVQTLFGMVQSGVDIRSRILDNDSKYLDNAIKVLLGVSYADEPNQTVNSDGSVNTWQFGNSERARISRLLGARHGRKYQSAVNLLVQSLSGQDAEYDMRTHRAQGRQDYYGISGSSFYSEFHDVMEIVRGSLSDLAQSELVTRQKAQTSKNVYEQQYTEGLNAEAMSKADVSIKQSEASQEGSQAKIMSAREKAKTSLDEIISKLDARAQQGNWVAELGSIIMSFLSVKYFAL